MSSGASGGGGAASVGSNSNHQRGAAQRPNGQTQNKICQFKLVLLGESAVGKSSLVLRYHSLAPMYYRGAQAAIVVYDITNQDTFGRAKTWVKELQRQASPTIVIALAGNKQDLANKRMVEYEEAQSYADENTKKLPKNDQSGGGGGGAGGSSQGRRLAEGDSGARGPAGACCK
ncbi:unnamed protein product [Callosobruchus maculatus]|uniref:Uncharacterized protein n=1 Tax=Callosobruchus maculatus TaxID=64391 RepID=A0A653D8C0_CALMS|nr:unnamed protein product [Callosobruchus maculatus]